MAPMIIFLAVPRLLHGSKVPTGPHMLLTERSLVGDYVSSHASSFINWVSQPRRSLQNCTHDSRVLVCNRTTNQHLDILLLITVWWITFTVVVTVGLCLGFGPSGIIAGEKPLLQRPCYKLMTRRFLRCCIPVLGIWCLHSGRRYICDAYRHGNGWPVCTCCCGRRCEPSYVHYICRLVESIAL